MTLTLHGSTYDEASAYAYELGRGLGATYVSAFDDPRTIAGQGTVGYELTSQIAEPLDVLLLPVGGGGLASRCGDLGARGLAADPDHRGRARGRRLDGGCDRGR